MTSKELWQATVDLDEDALRCIRDLNSLVEIGNKFQGQTPDEIFGDKANIDYMKEKNENYEKAIDSARILGLTMIRALASQLPEIDIKQGLLLNMTISNR